MFKEKSLDAETAARITDASRKVWPGGSLEGIGVPQTGPEEPVKYVAVTLSVYGWHRLLQVLENQMRIGNADSDSVSLLYETVVSQLSGFPVKVVRKEKGS